ncbi:DNA polymerase family B-domain-containing protein [Dunaliella salina]|nr:DNA polymerase family B-domain-containing protein [Dunaliella salina]|eukprot:KAF5833190.1 DNA polymerase family B-domain-containing protein [Dunaliella salina]
MCRSESDLLSRWRLWFTSVDPDCVATFQVRDTLGALVQRAEACQLPPQPTPVADASTSQSARSPAAKASGSNALPRQSNGVGELHLSRLKTGHRSLPLSTKSIVTYSPSWVKSQSRMASTSNQETFAAEGMNGRLVFDLLRQVITSQSLATFSFVLSPRELSSLWQGIAAQEGNSLGKDEEASGEESDEADIVLNESRVNSSSGSRNGTGPASKGVPGARGGVSKVGRGSRGKLTSFRGGRGRGHAQGRGSGVVGAPAGKDLKQKASALGRLFPAGPQSSSSSSSSSRSSSSSKGQGETAARKSLLASAPVVRLARYSMARTEMVLLLLQQLATIPECFEMARVTGLSLNQVAYKAQMSRTWSLLLRCARRSNFVIGGKQEQGQLTESPFLLHPVESGTAALYSSPVAVMDFASLYPSIYRAHNLCYTTLVVPEDVEHVGLRNVVRSPSGHYFAMPHIQQGILPSILAALVTARARTRAALDALPAGAAAWAVLDSRQKALKVVANALYGFTGAPASPLQCVPLADACLAFGAQLCRTAMEAVPQLLPEVSTGPEAYGGRVIYAQTDSLFVHFPAASAHQAVLLGEKLAKLVTERCFKHPIDLRFENVFKPFLLLHVNRYAGRSFANAQQAAMDCTPPEPSQLKVKGVKSMWRQSAPIVQNCLQGVLERMLLHEDIPGAVAFAEAEIHRLLTGRIFMWELIMNGGLWRVTGAQVAQEASAPGSEDVRGPHASLAIKLTQRDPNRPFLLGERVPYVLLSGFKKQDEAAEDPLMASEAGLVPNLDIYYHNKLKVPLEEIMQKVLKPSDLNHLLSGPHTSVRIEAPLAGSAEAVAGCAAAAGIGGAAGPTDTLAMRDPSKASKSTGGRQSGLTGFFKAAPKCLSCKQAIPSSQQQVPGSQLTPGLCGACLKLPGRWVVVHQQHLEEANVQHQLLAATAAKCSSCHSGGLCGAIACTNGECHVLHTRLGAARNLATERVRLERVEECGPEPALTW